MKSKITVELEPEKLKRLLKISVNSYLEEISRLLALGRVSEQPKLVYKVYELAQEAAYDADLLERVNSEVSQES